MVSLSWLTPKTMVASAPSEGAETSTRLAPAVRWAEAFALALKMPVHSSAMSTPSSFHGSVEGSRTAVTLILPLPTLIESPSTVTVPGKRPCTESKRSRWALVSTGPRSLIADHFDVLAAGLGDGAQHIAADAAKPVDRDPNCHARFSSNS